MYEIMTLEELQEFEYNIVYNPNDTTGCGYLDDSFIEFFNDRYEEALEYYYGSEK